MKLAHLFLAVIITIGSVILSQQIIANSISNQQNKNDYAELNHIKYGLLSIDEWKLQIADILTAEIKKLDLSKTNERDLRNHIEELLNTLIDQIDQKIREENAGSPEGWLKQAFINIFISLQDIKKGVPEYADAVMQEINDAETTDQLKALLSRQLEQYFAETFDTQDRSQMSRILLATGAKDIGSARIMLDKEILATQNLIFNESALLILLTVILFALSGFSKAPLPPSHYILLIICLVVLLVPGVITPMIDLEATISQVRFVLMGHTIHFDNQVLYFQSKSILDVFWIMITLKGIQMKFVGVLMITFSLIFPLLKIASSLGYYYNMHRARTNRVIRFFVFKSGKWSMADVMVVAIFMAYIGFNGIITSEFGKLSSVGQGLVILTTNGTSLQPGYYLFLTYTLLALFLAEFLARTPPVEAGNKPGEEKGLDSHSPGA